MPKASVIMPTFDKPDYLDLTLASFVGQTNRDFEIIVVDDGSSSDISKNVVLSYQGDLNIKYIWHSNRGRAVSRNVGIRNAAGEILIFNDDDRIVSSNFIDEHICAHNQSTKKVVIGLKHNILTIWKKGLQIRQEELVELLSREIVDLNDLENDILLLTPIEVRNNLEKVARLTISDASDNFHFYFKSIDEEIKGFNYKWLLGTTANLSVKKTFTEEVGLFDEAYVGWGMEDTDFSYRLYIHGGDFTLNRKAYNLHQYHLRDDGSKTNESLRRNTLYFIDKYKCLEGYLFFRWYSQKIGLLDANKLINSVSDSPRLRSELSEVYGRLFEIWKRFN